MHILLAASTTFEIQPTIDILLNRLNYQPANAQHSSTTADQPHPPIPNRLSTLVTGVGNLPTAWSLMRQIDRDRPDLIIQAGIAGSFTGNSHGRVLAIREESLADLGVWEDQRFKSLFDLRLADPNHHPFTAGRLVNPYQSLLALTGLQPVSSVTVNEISTHPGRITWYRENMSADVESMEGGALHYVGLQERIAFLQIRAVSNDIGVRDRSKWNIPLAIQRLNDRLVWLLQELDYKDITILNPINDAS